ncbi:hypothetical protein C8R47DRAFT_994150, partial [Mycena vitilis]
MTETHTGAGRKVPTLYDNHFTRIGKKADRSGRHTWKCKYCGDEENSSGACIEGRDNKLPQHLADSRSCPNAPAAARNEALRFMVDKKKKDEPSKSDSAARGADITVAADVIDVDAEPAQKKRKTIHGPMASFVDQAMTTTKQNSADRKLLRYIIHSNTVFRSVDNPFLHDFLRDLRPTCNAPGRYAL